MKYYLCEGRYIGTQKEAHGRPFEQVDIDISKEPLMKRLNELLDAIDAAKDTASLAASALILSCETADEGVVKNTPSATGLMESQSPSDTTQAKASAECDIEEAIAAADYPRALTLAHHIHHRLMEHGRAIGAAK